MRPLQYQQTPAGIMDILSLFHQHQLRYVLLKCEHIFAGENKNLDVLFETGEDYQRAASLLEQQGFVVRLPEQTEKYKTLYVGLLRGVPVSIHLHRRIAWHGMIALDAQEVFRRKVVITPLIIVPSTEDSILIHAAHVLFENFRVGEKEKEHFSHFPSADGEYLRQQAKKYHWSYGFQKLWEEWKGWKERQQQQHSPSYLPKRKPSLLPAIFLAWMEKLSSEPATGFYVGTKIVKKIIRAAFPRKRGAVLALIGVNGSGKTTLAKETLQAYQEIAQHLGKKGHYYYFGWNPEFPLTRLLSAINRKARVVSFRGTNLAWNEPTKSHFLAQELIFIYNWLEYLYRYYKNIYPQLRRGDLVVTDRYFYDLYGQNSFSRKSLVLRLLISLFPRPSQTFVLDVLEVLDTGPFTLQRREKTDKNGLSAGIKTPRKAFPARYLHTQRENYFALARDHGFPVLNTGNDVQSCVRNIVNTTWRNLV